MSQYGYIYLRTHESYDKYDAYKLGQTMSIVERDSQYVTGEIVRGHFLRVFRVLATILCSIEKQLKQEFNAKHHVQIGDGGTEFYRKAISNLIPLYFQTHTIWFEELTQDEINAQIYPDRNINEMKLYDYQQEVLGNVVAFYDKHDIGKLIWSCGLGKTYMSLQISKLFGFTRVLIGVPSIYLQKQFLSEILKVFPNGKNVILVGGDTGNATTNIKDVTQFLKQKVEPLFVITTYSSCHILVNTNIHFDFIIGDEAHHLVGIESTETKNYKHFHKICGRKKLFMTATEKNICNKSNDVCYSMENDEFFGDYLDTKSVCWAIEHKKITDYNLLVVVNKEKEIDDIIQQLGVDITDKNIFVSALMTLKSLEMYGDITHVLVCCNKIENADKFVEYVNILLEQHKCNLDKFNIYCQSLHSQKKINLNDEIGQFKSSKLGIISSVYIFGEGFDLPKLNAVVFAENMDSDIRIVQTALRPNRLDITNPAKIAHIIIPYFECNDMTKRNESFERVRLILGKMRNCDENIGQKIKFAQYNQCCVSEKDKNKYTLSIDCDSDDIDKLRLRLIHSRALASQYTLDKDEYNYVRKINCSLGILSKEMYAKFDKEKHECYVREPEQYFKKKGVWINWCDFLGIDTSKFIKTKEEWITFCKKQNVKSIEDYKIICDKYKCLPMNPCDFYIGFGNIGSELGIIKIRR